jgi:hypothetical protein
MTGTDEMRICYKCNYETGNPLGACPQCGHHLRTATQIKRLGIVMAALGGFLILFIGGIAVVVTGIILQSDDPNASSRFTGGPGVLIFMYGIFALVMMFGVTGLAAGIFQIKHGRRNTKLVQVILVLAGIFMAAGTLAQIFL